MLNGWLVARNSCGRQTKVSNKFPPRRYADSADGCASFHMMIESMATVVVEALHALSVCTSHLPRKFLLQRSLPMIRNKTSAALRWPARRNIREAWISIPHILLQHEHELAVEACRRNRRTVCLGCSLPTLIRTTNRTRSRKS